MTQHSILDEILQEVHDARRGGKKTLAVFDLDSTLFNVTPRSQKILKELASRNEFLSRFPQQAQVLAQVEFTQKDWGLREPLLRAGLGTHEVEFFTEVRDFWRQHFFSSQYLSEDQPYEGAVEYVNELKAAGAHIIYLTARTETIMGEGTIASLRQWNFPMHVEGCELIMKPSRDLDDAHFKKDIILSLDDDFQSVWFFENEPVNIHLVASECPNVRIVFFDSTHSGQAPPPTEHPIINHYLRPAKLKPK